MFHGVMHVSERTNDALRFRPSPGTNGRRTFRFASPATLQFVERGVELIPLAACEETPFERVLKSIVVFAFFTAGNLSSSAADVQPVENRVMPHAVVGALPNSLIESTPVVH